MDNWTQHTVMRIKHVVSCVCASNGLSCHSTVDNYFHCAELL